MLVFCFPKRLRSKFDEQNQNGPSNNQYEDSKFNFTYIFSKTLQANEAKRPVYTAKALYMESDFYAGSNEIVVELGFSELFRACTTYCLEHGKNLEHDLWLS